MPQHSNRRIGDVDPNERIDVTIKLRRKSEVGLPTLDAFVEGKRAFMSRHDLEEHHGAKAKDAQVVERWARDHKLSVVGTNLGRRQMSITGSAAAMSTAFGVKLGRFLHARTDTKFRCPETDLQVPAALAEVVTGVFGLNDMPVAVRRRKHAAIRPPAAKANAAADPKASNPGCFYPTEVAKLYNFPANVTGTSQKIAVLEFGGGFEPAILATYFTSNLRMNAAPTVNAIPVLGTQMDLTDYGTSGEVYLDIEVIGGMAPGATIDVYFAPWTGKGYLEAIESAIHNDDYAAVSISYGLDEDLKGTAANPAWPMLNNNVDEAFREAVAVGIPVFVSTGDQGSSSVRSSVQGPNGQSVDVTGYAPASHAGYPATSPFATAVGGTQLYAENGSISHEVVWNELGDLIQERFYIGGATGGGVSDHYAVPSYQTIVTGTLKSSSGNKTGRGVPDVAGNAGSTTGYLVSQPSQDGVVIGAVGGTSASAPMWAALMACVRQALAGSFPGGVPKFFLNDFVYACGLTAAFRDILQGRNLTYSQDGVTLGAFVPVGTNSSDAAGGYTAKAGYDLCTGWGSPNGAELLNQLTAWLKAQPPAQP